jgi:hypothetical protein
MQLVLLGFQGIALLVSLMQAEKPAAPDLKSPPGVVAALKKAIEANDLHTLALIASPKVREPLEKLAGPFAKAQAASARLDKAIAERPPLAFINPFAASLTPFAGMQIDLVEITKDGAATTVRVRFVAKSQPPREEVLALTTEGASWRIDLPAEVTKPLLRLAAAPDKLQKQAQGLERLATVLSTLTDEVEKERFKTKEALVLRLIQLVDEAKLPELFVGP